jgi:hypothetical protein
MYVHCVKSEDVLGEKKSGHMSLIATVLPSSSSNKTKNSWAHTTRFMLGTVSTSHTPLFAAHLANDVPLDEPTGFLCKFLFNKRGAAKPNTAGVATTC